MGSRIEGNHPGRRTSRWRYTIGPATLAIVCGVLIALPGGAFGPGLPPGAPQVLPSATTPGWARIHTGSGHPPVRSDAAMAYDAADSYVVLFGGSNGSAVLNDTWTYAGGVWNRLHPPFSPGPRFGASMAYDAADGYVVLFGGENITPTGWHNTWFYNETWSFVHGIWHQLSPVSQPGGRVGAQMAYDPAARAVILGGGYWAFNLTDMWSFQAGSWTRNTLAKNAHPFFSWGAMAFDSADRYLLHFGGTAHFVFNATWTYAKRTWTQQHPTSVPPVLHSTMVMAYEARLGFIVLFGPGGGNETWEYLAGVWKNVTGGLSPPTPGGESMTYDGADHYLLLFGGWLGGGQGGSTQTWRYR